MKFRALLSPQKGYSDLIVNDVTKQGLIMTMNMKVIDKDMRVLETAGGYHVLQAFDSKWNEWFTERLITEGEFLEYMSGPAYVEPVKEVA